MKRIILAIIGLWMTIGLAAQEGPTTTWPYLYPVFTDGTIYYSGGKEISTLINVHVAHGEVHFVDKDLVKQLFLTDEVYMITIGDDIYVNPGRGVMKVVAKNDSGCVVQEKLGDFAALAETGGAYGTSSTTSATRKLSSITTDAQINQPYMLLQQSKEDGAPVPLVSKYYIFTSGELIPASKKSVTDWLPSQRQDEWKAWLKQNKIRWKEPQSILLVLDFLNK